MFNFSLFKLICWFFCSASIDEDGWVSLDQSIRRDITKEEPAFGDFSGWVVFTKKIGDEQMMIRLPQEPIVSVLSSGEVEIVSEQDGARYLVRVMDVLDPVEMDSQVWALASQKEGSSVRMAEGGSLGWDLSYFEDGHVVTQKWILKGQHVYVLETQFTVFNQIDHDRFTSSLDIF